MIKNQGDPSYMREKAAPLGSSQEKQHFWGEAGFNKASSRRTLEERA